MRGAGEIRDREHRLEHGLQALVGPAAGGLLDHQELVVGRLLNLDEVRHLRDFLDVAEELANALATLTGFGAPSTRSLASLRPRPVMARTSLMTSIFLSPTAASTTVNSVFSSAGAAAQRQGRRHRDRGSGGHAPLLFEQLGELGGLEDGEARQVVDDLGL
jgi:hypothetical protein